MEREKRTDCIQTFALETSMKLSKQEKDMYLQVFLNCMLLDEAVTVLISWYIAGANRTGGWSVHESIIQYT